MSKRKFVDMNEAEKRYRINQMWRHLARRIFVFLKANPEVLASNKNQEVFDAVREIQIKYRLKQSPKYPYEDAAEFEDFMCELQAKGDGKNYYVSQDTMELYRPSTEHNETWKTMIFAELLIYYIFPEIYTKEIHELAEKKDEGQ